MKHFAKNENNQKLVHIDFKIYNTIKNMEKFTINRKVQKTAIIYDIKYDKNLYILLILPTSNKYEEFRPLYIKSFEDLKDVNNSIYDTLMEPDMVFQVHLQIVSRHIQSIIEAIVSAGL